MLYKCPPTDKSTTRILCSDPFHNHNYPPFQRNIKFQWKSTLPQNKHEKQYHIHSCYHRKVSSVRSRFKREEEEFVRWTNREIVTNGFTLHTYEMESWWWVVCQSSRCYGLENSHWIFYASLLKFQRLSIYIYVCWCLNWVSWSKSC